MRRAARSPPPAASATRAAARAGPAVRQLQALGTPAAGSPAATSYAAAAQHPLAESRPLPRPAAPSNRIQVSATKKPMYFYVTLSKVRRGHGAVQAVSTLMQQRGCSSWRLQGLPGASAASAVCGM